VSGTPMTLNAIATIQGNLGGSCRGSPTGAEGGIGWHLPAVGAFHVETLTPAG
jgi:hypothetical protein